MSITTVISSLPVAPTRADPVTFNDRADAYLTALQQFSVAIETWRTQANSTQGEINATQAAASAAASAADVARVAAEAARTLAATAAGAVLWSSATAYSAGNSAIGSNGYAYRAVAANTNDNPVTSTTGKWVSAFSMPMSYPDIRPSLDLNFALTKSLDPRVAFTRGSGGTYFDASGILKTALTNVPRFDHDPYTAVCKGLLIEEQRTNLLTYSENFDNSIWIKWNSSITPDAATAPDGTLTADKLVEGTTNTGHYLNYNLTKAASSVTYTFSIYCKTDSSGRNVQVQVYSNSWAGGCSAVVNLSTGVVTSSGVYGAGYTLSGVSVTPCVNGWYRIAVTCTTDANNSLNCWTQPINGTSTTYTGDGTSGIYVWGAQLEVGAFATSYVPSTETFTARTSSATFYGSNGLLQTAASGVARNTYNPSNLLAPASLLLEAQATNLFTYSEQIDSPAWVKNNVSVSANATAAPDGTVTADKIVDALSATDMSIRQAITAVSGSTYTLSCFLKAGEITAGALEIYTGGTIYKAVFNLLTGTLVASSGSGKYSIADVGNGWYRLSVTGVASSTTLNGFIHTAVGGNTTHTGDGVSGMYVWGAQLEAGAFATSYIPSTETFTGRAGSGTFYGSNGLIQTAASGVARNTYNPANLSAPAKLLLESQSTNLLTYSEQFDNAAWTKSNANITVTANAAVSPDGATTADRLVISTGGTDSRVTASATVANDSTIYTASVYVKRYSTESEFRFDLRLTGGTTAKNYAYYLQWSTLVVAAVSGGDAGLATSVVDVGNGWYRVSVTGANNSTGNTSVSLHMFPSSTGGGTAIAAGSVYAWGAQLEARFFATSYIATTTAQVTRISDSSTSATTTRIADSSTSAQSTRAADVATMTGTNFSSWYRQDEGSFVLAADTSELSATKGILAVGDSSLAFGSSNFIAAYFVHTYAGRITQGINVRGASQAYVAPTYTQSAAVTTLAAMAYKANDCSIAAAGSQTATDASASIPAVSSMSIGSLNSGWLNGGTYLNGHLARLTYYPKRLTDTQLVALSKV